MSEAEIHMLSERVEAIKKRRNADTGLLSHQIAMMKAIYRRVVFMSYAEQHPFARAA